MRVHGPNGSFSGAICKADLFPPVVEVRWEKVFLNMATLPPMNDPPLLYLQDVSREVHIWGGNN